MRRKPKPKKPEFRAPANPRERIELRRKAMRKWPHRRGTPVTYYPVRKRDELSGDPKHTETRTSAFYSKDGKIAVFIKNHVGYVLTSHLVVRGSTP